ncbi:MAG: transposase, partial [Alphaproteobacteria bacterium]
WREGEVRPTAQPKPSKPRHRPVLDPFAAATTELKAGFDDAPGITGAARLEPLQQRHAGAYPDHLIRTAPRRVRVWRQERARG